MEAAQRYGAFVVALVALLAGFALGDYGLVAWAAAAVLACLGVVLLHPRFGILATSMLGFCASAYLFQRKLDDTGTSICNVDAHVNCDVVNGSAASMLFGMPIAMIGSAFFLGVAAASVLQPSRATRLYQPVALFGAVGTVYSVWLGYQAWLIGAVCVFCLTIYACNLLLVVAGIRGVKEEVPGLLDSPEELPRSSAWLVISGVFLVLMLLGQSWWSSHGPKDAAALLAKPPSPGVPPAPTDDLATVYAARADVPLEGDEPLLGNPNGKIQIVEYADFLCPHCAQSFPIMHQLVEQNPEIGLRFRVFPLTGECNPVTPPGNHPERCRAAMAAQCAHVQGRFWEYAGLLFANQQQMGEELLAAAGTQVGLDMQQFSACMQDPATLAQVQRDGVSGGDLQLYGTPAFYVKGLTPGGGWAESCEGPLGVVKLLQALESGTPVPPSTQPTCPRE